MPTPESFLLAFHRAHPGCTSEAFARGRVDGTGSSYDLLASVVPAQLHGRSVLDLGCGDGHLLELVSARGTPASQLVGVDFSPDELRLARSRAALEGATLHESRAQDLPLPDGSVAAVLSHLALMLMDDVDHVLREVVRVLAPGGVFGAVLGGGPKVGDSFELFLDLLVPVLRREGCVMPRLGDPRVLPEEGLNELLGRDAGFAGPPQIDDFSVDLGGTPEEVWLSLSTIYEMHALRPEARAELRAQFVPAALALGDDGITVPCSMFVRRALAVRA